MRSLWLSLGLLAVPLMFTSPAGGADVLSACCGQPPGESHPDADPHNGPILVIANVRRPDERALEASAEAPVPVEVPLANAVASPRGATPQILVPPMREPVIANEPTAPDTDNPNGPPCCQPASEDGHADSRRFLALPRVERPNERTLAESAEAPVPEEVSLANAVALPADEPRIVVPPMREPIIIADDAAPQGGGPIPTPPCCQVVDEVHAPDRHPEEAPPVLVGANVTKRDERALEAAVELPIPAEAPRVNAIGIQLNAQRGVSEPIHPRTPVDAVWAWPDALKARAGPIAAVLLILLGIGLGAWWSRRGGARLEDQPAGQPRLPDVLTRLLATTGPVVEATRAVAREREFERS